MSYTARNRDRHRLAVSAVTGVITVGSLTSVGWLTGAAAEDFEQEQAEKEAQAAQQQAEYQAALARSQRRDVLRQRPARTRVTTRYVAASPSVSSVSSVGSGGIVSRPSTSTASQGSSNAGPGGGSSGSSGPSAPPPPPPPPPPSSSGS